MANRYDIDESIYITDSFRDEDVSSLVKYLNNPKICENTLKIPFPYTTKDGQDFIEKIKLNSMDSTRSFAIRLQTNNELIGVCGIHRFVENKSKAEIGYWLGEPYWHRGLMPKVVAKVVAIMKVEWKDLVRIEGLTFVQNKPSMRVLEKCGFRFEGFLPKHHYKNGQAMDEHLYALNFE